MWKPVVFCIPLLPLAACAGAQEEAARPIRFARQPSLSPDGKRIAFSYLGDLWTVDATGGAAARVTIHDAHDQLPAWSPDGKWLAFSSKRDGNYDVWLIPAGGGRARQLTFHSADDFVSGWSPDGAQVLFSSARETTRSSSLYTVHRESGAVRQVARDYGALVHASFTPDGRQVAATRGAAWTRKGYRGSGNSDLLLFPMAGGAGRWLVRESENERWPLVAPDGQSVYYVSDRSGVANLWKRPLTGGAAVPVTRHTDGNLFYPTLSRDGDRLVYEHDFGLWSVSTRGGEPVELRVFAPSDDRSNSLRRETFTSGAQEAVPSPDGKQLAFIVHGEVWVQPAAGGEATRLTDTPQREQDLAWSPDGKALAFSSDRDGDADLFSVDVKTKETRRLTRTPAQAEHSPAFSPDGKSLAFLCGYNGTELCVVPAEGGEPRSLVRDPAMGGVEWSPDSRWIAYHRMKSHSAGTLSDIFVINVAIGTPVNVSRYPVVNLDPAWSADGKQLFFRSDRTGNMNLWSVALEDEAVRGEAAEKEAADKKPLEVRIDLEEIQRRAKQITRGESEVGAYAVAPDGKTAVFAMSQLGRTDLWKVATTGGAPTRLTQSGEAGSGLRFAPDGAKVTYLSGGGIRSFVLSGTAASGVPFSARMDVDTRAELTQMFDEAWRKMRDSFYDEKMHGADWNAVRAAYRPILADIGTKEDFYAMFALVLGELNASHTGLSGATGGGGPVTASLGVEFDDAYSGPGVRVKSVMPRGPASRETSRLSAGDLVLKVDGQPVTGGEQLYALLADKADKQVELAVRRAGGDMERVVKLRAISQGEYRRLEYDRWTRECEQAVERQSGGKLGYLHLSAMNDDNLEKFKRAVFGDMQARDGLVLDLRFNGGGSIADEILAILQDRVFSHRTMRGSPQRLNAPLQVWTKPVTVLINEASFSNAEAFPWGFKTLKLGKVVGVPTYGGCIGTGSTTLIDGSTLRTPSTGAYTLDGVNMENNGCPPDLYVENTPEDTWQGRDRQLEQAVQELVKQTAPKRAMGRG